jgi:hypothetical protein
MTELRGARTPEERDAIVEAVVRHIASEPAPPKTWFVGFEYHDRNGPLSVYMTEFDLVPALLSRLRDLEPRVRPVSVAKWGRTEPPGLILDTEDSANGVKFLFEDISMLPEDEAEVRVRSHSGVNSGTGLTRFRVALRQGKWRVTEERLIGILD